MRYHDSLYLLTQNSVYPYGCGGVLRAPQPNLYTTPFRPRGQSLKRVRAADDPVNFAGKAGKTLRETLLRGTRYETASMMLTSGPLDKRALVCYSFHIMLLFPALLLFFFL